MREGGTHVTQVRQFETEIVHFTLIYQRKIHD